MQKEVKQQDEENLDILIAKKFSSKVTKNLKACMEVRKKIWIFFAERSLTAR